MTAASSSRGKGKILIVDDEPMMTEVLDYQLQNLGYLSAVAHSGDEALGLLARDATIDLVLSDINMAIMPGDVLLQKALGQGIFVPFVFMTGFCSNATLVKAVRLGAVDFIEKPIIEPELKEVLDRALRISEHQAYIDDMLDACADSIPETIEAIDTERRKIAMLRIIAARHK